jgi:hypothetical protein
VTEIITTVPLTPASPKHSAFKALLRSLFCCSPDVKDDDTTLQSWAEYRTPDLDYRIRQYYSTRGGTYSSSYSPYRDFPTLPSPLNRQPPRQRRPRRSKFTRRVQTIIEMDERSTLQEEQLNEVAHYGTLDGRPGALEYSGHQWLSFLPSVSPPQYPNDWSFCLGFKIVLRHPM